MNARWPAPLRKPAFHCVACIAALAFAALATTFAFAQDKAADMTDLQALRGAAKADKRGLVSRTLDLSPTEAKRFWPIYDEYQRDLEAWSRRRVVALEAVLFRDAAMTNLAAKNLVKELTLADEAEVRARRTLRKQVMRALPAVKGARYLQLEDKLQSIRDYDIASTVPLVH
jgi:hypothetical protein